MSRRLGIGLGLSALIAVAACSEGSELRVAVQAEREYDGTRVDGSVDGWLRDIVSPDPQIRPMPADVQLVLVEGWVFEEQSIESIEALGACDAAWLDAATAFAEASADLGTVVVGEPSVEFAFDLSNIGFAPTEITSFAITGTHAADFAFSNNNCAFRPLNPRATCSVGITFTPSDAGRRTALVELFTHDDQYTTMILAGDGEFAPVLDIAANSVDAGRDFIATGSQYPPLTEVTIVFGDGPNSSVTATTDEACNFAVVVPVAPNERGGDRVVVVQSASGAAASAPVGVIEDEANSVGLPGFGLG